MTTSFIKKVIEKCTYVTIKYVEMTDEPSVFAKCIYNGYTIFIEHFLEDSYYNGNKEPSTYVNVFLNKGLVMNAGGSLNEIIKKVNEYLNKTNHD